MFSLHTHGHSISNSGFDKTTNSRRAPVAHSNPVIIAMGVAVAEMAGEVTALAAADPRHEEGKGAWRSPYGTPPCPRDAQAWLPLRIDGSILNPSSSFAFRADSFPQPKGRRGQR